MTNSRPLKRRLFKRDGWHDFDPDTGHKRWFALCAFGCGMILTYETATIDHYPIPRRRGGGLTMANTRLACQPCNTRDGGPAGAATHIIPQGLTPLERRQWWQHHHDDHGIIIGVPREHLKPGWDGATHP